MHTNTVGFEMYKSVDYDNSKPPPVFIGYYRTKTAVPKSSLNRANERNIINAARSSDNDPREPPGFAP